MKKEKTLIIHPEDPSTSFLRIIYENIEDKTVITGGVSKSQLRDLIREHDRVMMMGHGSPYGLFSVGKFNTWSAHIIDSTLVPFLKEKKNNVFIWCNADIFVKEYELDGFFSGMFISEVGEANHCKVYGVTQDIVDESNFKFCEIMSNHVVEDKEIIFEKVKEEYGLLAEENPVALYNNNRLYING